MDYFTKTSQNDLTFKKSIINTYLENLDNLDNPPLKKTLAYDFKNYKTSNGIQHKSASAAPNFSKYLQSFLKKYTRTFELKVGKSSYIFFKEDILYLLENYPESNLTKNLLNFIVPKYLTFIIKNEISENNVYIVQILGRKKAYTNALLSYYNNHEHKPDFITKLGTTLFLSYTDRSKRNFICEELKNLKPYSRDTFYNLLMNKKKKDDYIKFIVNNYSKIHKQK